MTVILSILALLGLAEIVYHHHRAGVVYQQEMQTVTGGLNVAPPHDNY